MTGIYNNQAEFGALVKYVRAMFGQCLGVWSIYNEVSLPALEIADKELGIIIRRFAKRVFIEYHKKVTNISFWHPLAEVFQDVEMASMYESHFSAPDMDEFYREIATMKSHITKRIRAMPRELFAMILQAYIEQDFDEKVIEAIKSADSQCVFGGRVSSVKHNFFTTDAIFYPDILTRLNPDGQI